MRRFDAAATEHLLDYPTLIATLATVVREYGRGEITSPERLALPCGDGRGTLLSMPCQAHDLVTHKLLTVYAGNKELGLPTIQGDVTCFDQATGTPLFCLDAATVTARRTASVTMLAFRTLRQSPPISCLLIGTGTQAEAHVGAALELYPDLLIHVQGRSDCATAEFCARVGRPDRVLPATAEARRESDVVVAVTTSMAPVFDEAPDAARLVIGAGSYRPDMVEIGGDIVRGSQVYVDDIVGAASEAGDLLAAGTDWAEVKTFATALDQPPSPSQPVFFKSVGCGAWDLAACRTARLNAAGC